MSNGSDIKGSSNFRKRGALSEIFFQKFWGLSIGKFSELGVEIEGSSIFHFKEGLLLLFGFRSSEGDRFLSGGFLSFLEKKALRTEILGKEGLEESGLHSLFSDLLLFGFPIEGRNFSGPVNPSTVNTSGSVLWRFPAILPETFLFFLFLCFFQFICKRGFRRIRVNFLLRYIHVHLIKSTSHFLKLYSEILSI